MSETTATPKTMNKILVVPSSWVAYQIDEDFNFVDKDIPSVVMMEALVMVGKAKRLAAVHTFNAAAGDGEEESDSPFTGDESD